MGRSRRRSSCSQISASKPAVGGWRSIPRLLADITGDGRADIVGFGERGVFVALSNGDGSFAFTPQLALEDFGS